MRLDGTMLIDTPVNSGLEWKEFGELISPRMSQGQRHREQAIAKNRWYRIRGGKQIFGLDSIQNT